MLSDLKLSQRLRAVNFSRVSGFVKIDWHPKHRGLSVAPVSRTGEMIDTAVCFIYIQYRCHRATELQTLYAAILRIPSRVYYILNRLVSDRFQFSSREV
jgi:hypothetical protein